METYTEITVSLFLNYLFFCNSLIDYRKNLTFLQNTYISIFRRCTI